MEQDSLKPLKETVMTRDECTEEEFEMMLEGALQDYNAGDDPEEVVADWFGLEPDYVFDFLELAAKRH